MSTGRGSLWRQYGVRGAGRLQRCVAHCCVDVGCRQPARVPADADTPYRALYLLPPRSVFASQCVGPLMRARAADGRVKKRTAKKGITKKTRSARTPWNITTMLEHPAIASKLAIPQRPAKEDVPFAATRENCVYTKCYCEENIYQLCRRVKSSLRPVELLVCFISNPAKQVRFLCCTASMRNRFCSGCGWRRPAFALEDSSSICAF